MSSITPNLTKLTKLGSRGLAHYVVPLVAIVAIASVGTFWMVASKAATPVRTKDVTLKVVIRKLPKNCGLKDLHAQLAYRSAHKIQQSGANALSPTSNKCERVKSGGQIYYRATITFTFNNVPVYSKVKDKNPVYWYDFDYAFDLFSIPNGPVPSLKFQNPQHAKGYTIDGYADPGLRSPDFKKFRPSYGINLEAYR